MSTTKALVVRIGNYAKPQHNLPGLERDTAAFIKVLQRFGITDIESIVDDRADKAGILSGLNRLVDGAEDGDVRIFYYTGHGIQIQRSGSQKPFEAIVPYEASTSVLIPDMWMKQFLRDRLPEKCSFYGIYDCCNSGELQKKFSLISNPEDEIIRKKEISWTEINHDGRPELMPIDPEMEEERVFIKAFVEDSNLANSVHFGAAEPHLPALVIPMELNGELIQRSVFTRALELAVKPGMTVSEVETKVSEEQAQLTNRHIPQLATNTGNSHHNFFSSLLNT